MNIPTIFVFLTIILIYPLSSWGEVSTYQNKLQETERILDELILQNITDTPEEIKACVKNGISSIEAITEVFSGPEREADCRPAKLPLCEPNNDRVPLTVTLVGDWKIDRNLKVIDVKSSHKGKFTDPVKLSDITVEAFAECTGNGCAGAGEYAKGYIEGVKRRVVNRNEVRQIVGKCIENYGAKILNEKYRKNSN